MSEQEYPLGPFVFNSKRDFHIFLFFVVGVALVPICGFFVIERSYPPLC